MRGHGARGFPRLGNLASKMREKQSPVKGRAATPGGRESTARRRRLGSHNDQINSNSFSDLTEY